VRCRRATWADDVVQQALLIGVYAFLVPEATKIAVVYYSATGNVHGLAQAVAAGAEEAGAEVRLRHVEELASELLISQNQYWGRHRSDVAEDPSLRSTTSSGPTAWRSGRRRASGTSPPS